MSCNSKDAGANVSFPATSSIAPATVSPTHFVASPNWYSSFPVAVCTADSKPFFRESKGFDHGGGGASSLRASVAAAGA